MDSVSEAQDQLAHLTSRRRTKVQAATLTSKLSGFQVFFEMKTIRGSISLHRSSLKILTKSQHEVKLTGNYSLLG